MSARRMARVLLGTAVAAALLLLPTELSAQRGGGRGGGGGGGGGSAAPATRMAIFTATFTLDSAQKKQVKAIFDAGYKDAAPLRDELAKARVALGTALQTGKSAAEIDAATKAYATQATAMMQAETKALSQFVLALNEEQRANTTALQSTLSMMRGIFVGKKWDMAPDLQFY
jgi:alkanesulfonate monooxygenase SsuD/methylene tetrahydromethanopterin reductase-like flavin-dependent oxidoreductase (luciferase family)